MVPPTAITSPNSADVVEARKCLDDVQFARYQTARSRNTGHGLALVIASRCPPRVIRRDERWRLTDERPSFGRSAPSGKYQAGLADFPGDPTAFVSSRHEAEKVAEAKGLSIIDEPVNARCALQNESDDDDLPELGDLLME
jgi:hypothetical protein